MPNKKKRLTDMEPTRQLDEAEAAEAEKLRVSNVDLKKEVEQ